jgi:hypothetical protein
MIHIKLVFDDKLGAKIKKHKKKTKLSWENYFKLLFNIGKKEVKFT